MFAFDIKPVKAMETIYIRADGSIDPPTAPIQRDGNFYTLMDDIFCEPSAIGIEIECSDITLDGMGHSIHGHLSLAGIYMFEVSGVTIRNIQIKGKMEAGGFGDGGILIQRGSDILIEQNTWMYNYVGITLYNS